MSVAKGIVIRVIFNDFVKFDLPNETLNVILACVGIFKELDHKRTRFGRNASSEATFVAVE